MKKQEQQLTTPSVKSTFEGHSRVFLSLRWLIPVFGLSLVLLHWLTDEVKTNNLLYQVNSLWQIKAFETPYIYVYLHLFTFIPVFSLSFDKKVAYYKNWKTLFSKYPKSKRRLPQLIKRETTFSNFCSTPLSYQNSD